MLDVASMVVVGTAHISSLKIRPKRRRYLQDQLTLAAGRGLGSDWHVERSAAAVQTDGEKDGEQRERLCLRAIFVRWRFSLQLLHHRKERKGKEVLWLEILLLLNSTAARWPTSAPHCRVDSYARFKFNCSMEY